MHYVIDPLRIKSIEERQLLQTFLNISRDRRKQKVWKNQLTHFVDNNSFELTHYLVLKQDNVINVPTYYVVAPYTLFQNENTTICPIECELSFLDDQSETYHPTKHPLIVKIQSRVLTDQILINTFVRNMNHEFKYSKLMSHLGAESIVNAQYPIQNTPESVIESVMVLKKMPGIDLFDFISTFFHSAKPYLPCMLRMRITLEILRTFQKQIFELGIFHGDLKLENTVINLNIGDNVLPPKFNAQHIKETVVNFIDPAGAEKYGNKIEHPIGTRNYCAPEILALIDNPSKPYVCVKDEKPDMFSIGKMLGAIWHCSPELSTLPNEYDFDLMSSLMNNLANAKPVMVYLDERHKAFFVKGMKNPMLLPESIDLSNLESKLNDADFKKTILAMTAKTGYTKKNSERFAKIVQSIYSQHFSTESSWFTLNCLANILNLVRQTTHEDPERRLSFNNAANYACKIANAFFIENNADLFAQQPLPTPLENRCDGATSAIELSLLQDNKTDTTLVLPPPITPDTVTTIQSPVAVQGANPFGLFSPPPIIGNSTFGANILKPTASI